MVRFAVSALPIVSVCIANYNGAGMISGCIESVLGQDFDFPVEILVHDDASTDNSADVVARDYPGVRLIRSDSNVGFCVANNRMVAMAKGAYILLLNNDAELYLDALRVLHDQAKKIDGPAILSLPQYDFVTGELIDRGCLLDPFFNPVPNVAPGRSDVAMVIGACLWIPGELWKQLGGFPDWFGSIGEDMYLCCRARLAGNSVRVLSDSGYLHRQGRTFGGNRVSEGRLKTTFRRRSLSERNKTFVMLISSPLPQLLLAFPLHFLLILLEGLIVSTFKWDIAVWKAIYAPIFPALWRERKRIFVLRGDIHRARVIGSMDWLAAFVVLPYKMVMFIRHGFPEIK